MTIRETASILGLKVRTIRKWIDVGYIKAEKRGKCWYISEKEINSEEVQNRADKSREHSRRIKEGRSMGVLAGGSQNSQESIQRSECAEQ